MTNSIPCLSVVTPTRGNFSAPWRDAWLALRGDVEWILVYPPNEPLDHFADARVRVLVSPQRGEVIQRLIGLLNARGRYVLALDDDDVAHPDLAVCAEAYFARFPSSWVLRPRAEHVAFDDTERLARAWASLPDVSRLEIRAIETENEPGLIEIPIAPLETRFRWRHLFVPTTPRREMHGIHFENFNNRVWRNEIVQPALRSLAEKFSFPGAFSFYPRYSLDRLLGLYVQAYYFQPQKIIGHLLGGAPQLRRTYRPAAQKEFRLYGLADALLARSFPRYGYFWNLFFFKLYQESAAALYHLFTRRVP